MPISPSVLEEMLQHAFPCADIRIKDLRGDRNHYSLSIISRDFVGKSRVQQHRMVFEALQGKAGTDVHALSIKTGVPSL